jgi:regulator of replication initiation timing
MAKNDLSMLKTENERLTTEVERLKRRLREEITRTQAGVRLDLNLEKGRMREESSKQELKIKEVDTRIEQEIANLKTNIQASKATTLQYLVGFGMCVLLYISAKNRPDFCVTIVTGCSALLMAYLRFRV